MRGYGGESMRTLKLPTGLFKYKEIVVLREKYDGDVTLNEVADLLDFVKENIKSDSVQDFIENADLIEVERDQDECLYLYIKQLSRFTYLYIREESNGSVSWGWR